MEYRHEYDLKLIGKNLRRLRERKGLSVEYVREYLRLGSVQAVYKYERGLCFPRGDTLIALMELYEANISDLVLEVYYEVDYEIFQDNLIEKIERAFLSAKDAMYNGRIKAYLERLTKGYGNGIGRL